MGGEIEGDDRGVDVMRSEFDCGLSGLWLVDGLGNWQRGEEVASGEVMFV